ncbi:peptidoglycan DD-metalloendopeptidase family protein [Vibrio breoganii]|uniref:peptidoglycan DD-metalloendopeptidase family protein n=1 Tax=Vibrio breoganii TaxID=553239 RepID=UPI000C841E60|nr:peptidoglycan DD-metalloendopeptidase family protein [Vibrio breoganii]PMK53600.1 peptidase M23 [Vibrio breoganii]
MKHFRLIALAIAIVAFTLAFLLPKALQSESNHGQDIDILITQAPEVPREPTPVRVHYFVKVGDTLSDIFSAWELPYSNLQQVLSADEVPLQLDTIKPGDHLEFVIDPVTRQIISLTYNISLVERATYTQIESGEFDYHFIEEEGEWRETLYSGIVEGSFSLSAHKVGLSSNQIANITRVLHDKINFARELRAGDRFDVLINKQYLGDHPTGNSEIKGISFKLARKEVAAFLADDGRFYDREGNSLERAFNRYPVEPQFRRITSSFNPRRKHPVTGRITPHNGTDFATPVGAAIYSTGDGRVVGVRNHPYAGKYLVIEHNSVYTTRYLHLDRFLVKRGDYVERGQKIAIAGATGRITGPHLHFEVLVRNRAVDPMKADLPMASSISKENKESFAARISKFDDLTI